MSDKQVTHDDMTIWFYVQQVPEGFDPDVVARGLDFDLSDGLVSPKGFPSEYYDPALKGEWKILIVVTYEVDMQDKEA